jgi:hypothetical protein
VHAKKRQNTPMQASARQSTPMQASARQSTPEHANARQCTPEHNSARQCQCQYLFLLLKPFLITGCVNQCQIHHLKYIESINL